MDLSDPQTASELMLHVQNGGTFAQFAEPRGCCRQTVSRQLRKLPDLSKQLDAARMSAQTIAHHAPRMMPRAAPPADTGEPETALALPSRDEFVTYLWTTARNGDHRACAKCAGILAEILLAPEVLEARRKDAELSAGPQVASTLPVVVALPSVDRARERGVIDAEVVGDV